MRRIGNIHACLPVMQADLSVSSVNPQRLRSTRPIDSVKTINVQEPFLAAIRIRRSYEGSSGALHEIKGVSTSALASGSSQTSGETLQISLMATRV